VRNGATTLTGLDVAAMTTGRNPARITPPASFGPPSVLLRPANASVSLVVVRAFVPTHTLPHPLATPLPLPASPIATMSGASALGGQKKTGADGGGGSASASQHHPAPLAPPDAPPTRTAQAAIPTATSADPCQLLNDKGNKAWNEKKLDKVRPGSKQQQLSLDRPLLVERTC